MSSSRSRSHNGPTNPRNKPQTIPKRKRNSRSKGLSNSAHHQADGLRGWGGRSEDTRRTVCDLRADGSPNLMPQYFGTLKDPRANSQELDEHTTNTERADSPRATGGQSVGLEQNSPSSKTRSQPLLPIHGSPKQLELLGKDLGEMSRDPRGCYAPNHGSSNKLNRRESNRNRALPKS
jgi:hypothetical protein